MANVPRVRQAPASLAGPLPGETAAAQPERMRRQFKYRQELILILVLIVMLAVFGIWNGHFLSRSNLVSTAQDATEVGLLAIGELYVIITAGIDLSVGAILALAGVVGALAGVLVAGIQPNSMNPNGFDGLLIFGFTAAVIGGLDSPVGAVLGGLILGIGLSILDNYVSNQVDTFWTLCLLTVVLMVRPGGLFARARARQV